MVFVFGSNLEGAHAGGAARVAVQQHDAIFGIGVGRQGNAYAIPSIDFITIPGGGTLAPEAIQHYVDEFVEYALLHGDEEFQVTRIGCGIAGFTDEQIAPMFAGAPDNCLFDEKWKPFLQEGARYWGTF